MGNTKTKSRYEATMSEMLKAIGDNMSNSSSLATETDEWILLLFLTMNNLDIDHDIELLKDKELLIDTIERIAFSSRPKATIDSLKDNDAFISVDDNIDDVFLTESEHSYGDSFFLQRIED